MAKPPNKSFNGRRRTGAALIPTLYGNADCNMEDEVAGGILRTMAQASYFVIRVMIWGVIEYIIEVPCWYIGWPIARLITLGRLPKVPFLEPEKASRGTTSAVCIIGFSSLVAAGVALAIYLGGNA